jgi:hypothetical protein
VILLNEIVISYDFKKQRMIATSSTEAKFVIARIIAKEIV